MSDHETDLIERATYFAAHALTARLVTARKPHRCAFTRDASWARGCAYTIRPGDQYVRITTFPGHDVVDVTVPVQDPCCLACAYGYNGISSLVPADRR